MSSEFRPGTVGVKREPEDICVSVPFSQQFIPNIGTKQLSPSLPDVVLRVHGVVLILRKPLTPRGPAQYSCCRFRWLVKNGPAPAG